MTALLHRIIAIVPAAGIGSRMLADKPKQYLSLCGKTILEHSLAVLLSYSKIEQIIVAIAPQDSFIHQLEIIHHPKIKLVAGGETRADSVLAGLNAIEESIRHQTWVLVHDAARPCLEHQELDKLLPYQTEAGAILALPAVDTIKRADFAQQIQHTEDRDYIWLAQTPQYFRADLLRNALQQAFAQNAKVTDEASAMELMGFRPHLVAGQSSNIKVTHPEDLALAEFYLTRKAK